MAITPDVAERKLFELSNKSSTLTCHDSRSRSCASEIVSGATVSSKDFCVEKDVDLASQARSYQSRSRSLEIRPAFVNSLWHPCVADPECQRGTAESQDTICGYIEDISKHKSGYRVKQARSRAVVWAIDAILESYTTNAEYHRVLQLNHWHVFKVDLHDDLMVYGNDDLPHTTIMSIQPERGEKEMSLAECKSLIYWARQLNYRMQNYKSLPLRLISIHDTDARVIIVNLSESLINNLPKRDIERPEDVCFGEISVGPYRSLVEVDSFIEVVNEVVREAIAPPRTQDKVTSKMRQPKWA